MQEEGKTLKQYCREAKKRLKNGFWKNYHNDLQSEIIRAEKEGLSVSKIKEYYSRKVADDIKKGKDSTEEFYIKVKTLLDTEGEVSDAIGRLTDKTVFSTLSYEEKQRYTLELSEQYLRALDRYKKEKFMEI